MAFILECFTRLPETYNGSASGNDSGEDLNITTPSTTDNSLICNEEIPTMQEFLTTVYGDNPYLLLVLGLLVAIALVTLGLYIEQVIIINRKIEDRPRRVMTRWVLAAIPVYSLTALLAVFFPRAGTLVDFIANSFFASCLHRFLALLVTYFGGPQRMYRLVANHTVHYHTLPCCCYCRCLPTEKFTPYVFKKLRYCVLQCAITRPIIMCLAAILWLNGSYIPGFISAQSMYMYIFVLNSATTLTAMFGLYVLRDLFTAPLAKFLIRGKLLVLQLLISVGLITNIILNSLIAAGEFTCTPLMPTKGRGEFYFHMVTVPAMLVVSILARRVYCNAEDGDAIADDPLDLEEGQGDADEKASTKDDDGKDTADKECEDGYNKDNSEMLPFNVKETQGDVSKVDVLDSPALTHSLVEGHPAQKCPLLHLEDVLREDCDEDIRTSVV